MSKPSPVTIYGRFNFVKTGLGVLAMDNGQLLLKKTGEDYPCPFTAQETHALYNLLHDHRADIIEANTAAREYGTTNGHHTGQRGPHKKYKVSVYSE